MKNGSYEHENCEPHSLFELGIDICSYSASLHQKIRESVVLFHSVSYLRSKQSEIFIWKYIKIATFTFAP